MRRLVGRRGMGHDARAMMSVSLVGPDTWEAVLEGDRETSHRVTMSHADYAALSGRAFSHEWVIVQIVRVLQSSGGAVGARIDVADLRSPEFDEQVEALLHRRA